MSEAWKDVAAAKQAQRAGRIPKEWLLPTELVSKAVETNPISVQDVPATCGILSPRELEITETKDATDLLGKLASKHYTSVEVTTAFSKRAAIAQQLINCCTELFFDVALERAKFLDDYLEKNGKVIGPFHGLPISLKDSFDVKGQFSTVGFLAFADYPAFTEDSPVVKLLLDAGAVAYVKTNVPQTLMVAEGHNNLFGRTLNPWKLTQTAGGSSSGEGALLGIRGSILGVGTDIAGSIRIPAAMNGTYGLCPTPGRVPVGGGPPYYKRGSPGIPATGGPLGVSVRDLRLFFKVVIDRKPWDLDSTTLPIPWQDVPAKSTLRIGLLKEESTAPFDPPIRRTLKTAAERLAAAGHTLIQLEEHPSFAEVGNRSFAAFGFDNTGAVPAIIAKGAEPVIPAIQKFYPSNSEPRVDSTVTQVYDFNGFRGDVKEAWRKIYVENNLDVILTVGSAHVASKHDEYRSAMYTVMWNCASHPGAIIPFLKADKEIDVADAASPQYDPEESHGLPSHVQIVGRPFQEEALVNATEVIDAVLHPH